MSSLSSLCDPGLTTWLLFDGYELFLSEIEEFVGKETAIVNELLIRKGFQKLRFETDDIECSVFVVAALAYFSKFTICKTFLLLEGHLTTTLG